MRRGSTQSGIIEALDAYGIHPETEPADADDELKIICMDDVQTRTPEWLWEPYIPRGKLTIILGDPGIGKTFLTLHLAAVVSKGGIFLGESENVERMPEAAIYQTAEDGIADTIKRRLTKMEPDFKNLFYIDESKEGLSLSDERIELALLRLKPALLVIDPLQAYLGAYVDMHRANEVRPVLSRIGLLAEKYHTAIVLIMHLNKLSQAKALYRSLGSIDIPAAARSLLIIGRNPDDDDQRIIAHEKSSLAKAGKSIAFRISPDNGGVLFDGLSDLTADDITAPKRDGRNKPSVSLDEAVSFLSLQLGNVGYAPLRNIRQAAEDEGISQPTLYRAKTELDLQSVTKGYSANRITYWLLPDVDKMVIPLSNA